MLPPFDHSPSQMCHDQAHTTMTKENKNKEVLKIVAKDEYFIKNGGILLEKRIALSNGQDSGSGQVKILSSKDIELAVNRYKPNMLIGCCRTRIIYKGTLENNDVAITCPRELNPNHKLIDLWLTEVATLMVMYHENIIKLYGCCLETFIPIIVFEFLPNHSLFEHLHGPLACRNLLKWGERFKVATGVAYALSFMHNALSNTVVHRAVQSNSVFLGDSFVAKLANFSHSVAIVPGDKDTSQRWPVHGAAGYIDPEYVETKEVTDKCDVYSYGVLMLELLTRKDPVRMALNGIDLVEEFTSAREKGNMMEIMDSNVLNEASSDEIEQFVQFALSCVAKKGVDRPNMIEVASKLWEIRDQYNI